MYLFLIITLPVLCVGAIFAFVLRKGARDSAKKAPRIIVSVVLLLACALAEALLVPLFLLEKNKIISRPESFGSPYFEVYDKERIHSRLSEDLIVFDGRLYVGGGDYDANTGPVTVKSYDLEKGVWESSAEALEDEQIKRFCVLDGKLVTLGTDPKGDWSLGNYYIFDGGKWETVRALPSGIHCFDAIEFEDFTFFALGVNSGDYPITRYDGENYEMLEFYKKGELLDTSAHEYVRVYNLFERGGELFAFLTLDVTAEDGSVSYFMDLYRYADGAFEFVNGSLPAADMPDVVTSGELTYIIIRDTLLVSSDLVNFSALNLGKGVRVVDITEFDGKIYVLATPKNTGTRFESMVFEVSDTSAEKLFGFLEYNTPGAFCVAGEAFYISLGRRGEIAAPKSAGEIFRVGFEQIK